MGQARSKGTFEERKAMAIKAGRLKRPSNNSNQSRRAIIQEMLTSQMMNQVGIGPILAALINKGAR